jgi:hypothetical protein
MLAPFSILRRMPFVKDGPDSGDKSLQIVSNETVEERLGQLRRNEPASSSGTTVFKASFHSLGG